MAENGMENGFFCLLRRQQASTPILYILSIHVS